MRHCYNPQKILRAMAEFSVAYGWAPFSQTLRYSLILLIHGCIDGYSRRDIFLECSNNNLSQTMLNLFIDAIQNDGVRWPSRIRVDYGVENELVCDPMVEKRGKGCCNFIARPSTRNQRIARLCKDVFRCVIHVFYYTFRAFEDEQLNDIENPADMLVLRFVLLQRINQAINKFKGLHNNHPLPKRTSSLILLITQNFMELILRDLRHSKTVTIMLLSLS